MILASLVHYSAAVRHTTCAYTQRLPSWLEKSVTFTSISLSSIGRTMSVTMVQIIWKMGHQLLTYLLSSEVSAEQANK